MHEPEYNGARITGASVKYPYILREINCQIAKNPELKKEYNFNACAYNPKEINLKKYLKSIDLY